MSFVHASFQEIEVYPYGTVLNTRYAITEIIVKKHLTVTWKDRKPESEGSSDLF